MRSEDLIGKTIGHYRIIRPLGYGGTATVFLAQDFHLQREVAVKVFDPGSGDTQAFLRRFSREARVLAQLDHPNILPVYDYGEQDAIAYLVMPYMAGGSLKDFLQKRGPLPAQEAITLIAQILQGLQYAHDHNLIHRDIKPGNMLFKADGTLLLSDFGLVKVLPTEDATQLVNDSGNASQHIIMGTPNYMAPEQINGQVSTASDIYGIGVVLYEMLTGQTPFSAENRIGVFMKHLQEAPRSLRSLNPAITPALDTVILRTLAKEPAARYQQPSELLQALRRALSSAEPAQAAFGNAAPTVTMPTENASITPINNPRTPQPPVRLTPPSLIQPQYDPYSLPREQQINAFQGGALPPVAHWQGQTPLPPVAPAPVRRSSTPIVIALILLTLLGISVLGGILYAQGAFPFLPKAFSTPTTTTTAVPGTTTTVTASSGTSEPAPAQFSLTCPSAGKANKAYTPTKTGTGKQSLVYVTNSGTADAPGVSTLWSRAINQSSSSRIREMPGSNVSQAQISQDGQFVLFTVNVNKISEIRMIRTDGTYLQTLYCTSASTPVTAMQWSFDGQSIVFNIGYTLPTTYLLHTATGQVESVLSAPSNTVYYPKVWLTNSLLYLTQIHPNSDAPQDSIYLLDVSKGANQHDTNLTKVLNATLSCKDFDASYKADQLVLAAATCPGGPLYSSGPSTITTRSSKDGTGTQTVYNDTANAIVAVRSVTAQTLLFFVNNTTSGDPQKNGLWRVDLDGTHLQQLTVDPKGTQSFCLYSQNSWSNVSQDGTLYAVQSIDRSAGSEMISYGSMSGGSLNQIATTTTGLTEVVLIGWASL